MTKFFAKKLNKKGFTLAELLIVIAIIAILVAIAVPLFTSELQKAKVSRDKANIRAVKAAAIAIILDDANGSDVDLATGGPWYATGTFDGDGDLTDVTVSTTSADESEAGKISYPGTVIVEIARTDLSYTIS